MTRRSKAQWQELIEEYEASGLSMPAWCEAHGIKRSTFAKYYGLCVESHESMDTQWVAVAEAPPEKAYEPIQIAIETYVISVLEGFNPEHLAKICNVLVAL